MNRPLKKVAAAILSCASVVGCGSAQEKKAVGPKLTPVRVMMPLEKVVDDYVDLSGHVTALKDVQVRARVNGHLDKVLFQDGQEIRQGDPLFLIDRRPYQAMLSRAQATLAQAQAKKTRLEAEQHRNASLYKKGTLSRQDLDRTEGDYSEAIASLGSSQAALEQAELNFEWTRVTAPLTGRISQRLVDPGNLVRADVTPLTTIVALDPVYVYFDLDEQTLLKSLRLMEKVKPGAKVAEIPVQAGLADEPDRFPHVGTINFSDNQVNAATGTLRVRCSIPNPKEKTGDRLIVPGMYIRVRMGVGEPRKVLLVPEDAVGTDQEKRFLYLVDEKGQVIYRPVKLGQLQGGMRVIEDGLEPGERYVARDLARVRPGSMVDPQLDPAPERQAGPGPRVAAEPAPGEVSKGG